MSKESKESAVYEFQEASQELIDAMHRFSRLPPLDHNAFIDDAPKPKAVDPWKNEHYFGSLEAAYPETLTSEQARRLRGLSLTNWQMNNPDMRSFMGGVGNLVRILLQWFDTAEKAYAAAKGNSQLQASIWLLAVAIGPRWYFTECPVKALAKHTRDPIGRKLRVFETRLGKFEWQTALMVTGNSEDTLPPSMVESKEDLAYHYLIDHRNERITSKALAEKFGIHPKTLNKPSWKMVRDTLKGQQTAYRDNRKMHTPHGSKGSDGVIETSEKR